MPMVSVYLSIATPEPVLLVWGSKTTQKALSARLIRNRIGVLKLSAAGLISMVLRSESPARRPELSAFLSQDPRARSPIPRCGMRESNPRRRSPYRFVHSRNEDCQKRLAQVGAIGHHTCPPHSRGPCSPSSEQSKSNQVLSSSGSPFSILRFISLAIAIRFSLWLSALHPSWRSTLLPRA